MRARDVRRAIKMIDSESGTAYLTRITEQDFVWSLYDRLAEDETQGYAERAAQRAGHTQHKRFNRMRFNKRVVLVLGLLTTDGRYSCHTVNGYKLLDDYRIIAQQLEDEGYHVQPAHVREARRLLHNATAYTRSG